MRTHDELIDIEVLGGLHDLLLNGIGRWRMHRELREGSGSGQHIDGC